MEKIDHQISSEDAGSRLDRFIRRHHPMINQGRIEKLLRGGAIGVDGAKAKSSTRIAEGQIVTMPLVIMTEASKPKPQNKINPEVVKTVQQAVISRGQGWIALNKPSGLATQGGSGTSQHIDGALPEAFPKKKNCGLCIALTATRQGCWWWRQHWLQPEIWLQDFNIRTMLKPIWYWRWVSPRSNKG